MTEATLRIKVDSSETDKGRKSLEELANAGAKAEGSTKKLTEQTDRVSTAAKAAFAAFTALASSMAVREVIRYADEWQNAENRLKLVTSSSAELARVQGVLMKTANETRAGFSSTAELYTTLARSTTALGLTTEDLVGITRTINQTFAVAGASAAGMEGAIRQLSQGLASGALRGDEFNSVAEQAPGIMDALAASLKMSRGELREFAATGGITSEILVNALQSYASTAEGMAATATRTFGQSMTEARNNMLEFVGSSEVVKAGVSGAGQVVVTLSNNLDSLGTAAALVGAAMAARMVPGIAAGTASMLAGTTAAGALRGALLLLGGPAGATVLAVAGIAALVSSMETMEERTVRLREEVNSLSAAQIRNSIDALDREAEAARATIFRMEQTSKGYAAQTRAIEIQRARLAELEATTKQYNLRLSDLNNGIDRTTESTETQSLATESLAVATTAQASNTEYLNGVYRTLTGTVGITADEYLRLMGVSRETTAVMVTGANQTADAAKKAGATISREAEEAARESQRQWELTHNYLSGAFVDLMNNGGNAWDNIAKGFERMVQRMVAEWAASGLMSMFGIGAPSGNPGIASSVTGGLIRSAMGGGGSGVGAGLASMGGGVMAAGSQFLGGLTGGAIGTNTMVATSASTLGAGTAALAANPVTWAVLAAAALNKYFKDQETPSFNAGLFLGGSLGRPGEFAVDPFESGVSVAGYTRRADQSDAMTAIDTFRTVDAAVVAVMRAAGITDFRADASQLQGLDERGMGTGRFLGLAGEDGRPGATMDSQLTNYVLGLVGQAYGQGKIDAGTYELLANAGDYLAIIEQGKKLIPELEGVTGVTEKYTAEQQRLLDRLFPLQAQTKAYESDLQMLQAIFVQGSDEYANAAEKLKATYKDLFNETSQYTAQQKKMMAGLGMNPDGTRIYSPSNTPTPALLDPSLTVSMNLPTPAVLSNEVASNNAAMINELRNVRTELMTVSRATNRTADLLMSVTRDGESLVTTAA
jgi:tape measure domain-containing protein